VRCILQGDGPGGYVINADGDKIKLQRGSSDAAMLRPSISPIYIHSFIGTAFRRISRWQSAFSM
jgi:hypothetical protein